jgi:hypothetical protein
MVFDAAIPFRVSESHVSTLDTRRHGIRACENDVEHGHGYCGVNKVEQSSVEQNADRINNSLAFAKSGLHRTRLNIRARENCPGMLFLASHHT